MATGPVAGFALLSEGKLLGSVFLGGILGNLLASAGYDLGKVLFQRIRERFNTIWQAGTLPDHAHLIRVGACSQYDAVAALCEVTLIEDHHQRLSVTRFVVESLNRDPKEVFKDLRQASDAEVKLLHRIRDCCRARSSMLNNLVNPDELQKTATSLMPDFSAILQAAGELAQTRGFGDLREHVTTDFIAALESDLGGVELPNGLRQRLKSSWFDYLRVIFWNRILKDDLARRSLELHFFSHIDAIPRRLDEHFSQLQTLDCHLRWVVEALDVVHREVAVQAAETRSEVERAEADLQRALLNLTEPLDQVVGGLPIVRFQQAPESRGVAQLLVAAHRVTDLVGRSTELGQLWAWLHSPNPVSTFVISGKAGSGKTRLAIELLVRIDAEKGNAWEVGFVAGRDMRSYDDNKHWSNFSWRRPTVIVLDYAAAVATPLRNWFDRLLELDKRQRHPPLRVLLLEREAVHDQGWLEFVRRAGSSRVTTRCSDLFFQDEPLELPPLNDAADRRTVLGRMLQVVSSKLKKSLPRLPAPGSDSSFEQRLSEDKWASPLTLMMAAVVSAERGLLGALALSPLGLSQELVAHEKRRCLEFADRDRDRAAILEHLALVATLTGGLDREKAEKVAEQELNAIKAQWSGGLPALLRVWCELLPDGLRGVGPVVPDVVGEAFVAESLKTMAKPSRQELLRRCAKHAGHELVAFLLRLVADPSGSKKLDLSEWLEILKSEGLLKDEVLNVAFKRAMTSHSAPTIVQGLMLQAEVYSFSSSGTIAFEMVEHISTLLPSGGFEGGHPRVKNLKH
jgi:hypothetical protein